MKRARIAILTLAAVLPLILHVEQADACSCLPPGPPAEAYESSEAVFVGRVLAVEEAGEIDGDLPLPMLQVTLAVERAFKGVTGERAIVRTATNSAACGYHFAPGTEHLVYARGGETGTLSVSLCSRTQPLERAAEDITALEGIVGAAPEPEEPAPPSPGQMPPGKGGCAGCATTAGTGGGSVLLVLLLGLWLMRTRTGPRQAAALRYPRSSISDRR